MVRVVAVVRGAVDGVLEFVVVRAVDVKAVSGHGWGSLRCSLCR